MKASHSAERRNALLAPAAQVKNRAGFSMIETAIVLAIFMIASAITFINIIPAMRDAKANNGVSMALMQMRLARQLAVDTRKIHVLQFNAPDRIVLQRADVAGGALTLISNLALPTSIQFAAVAGIPTNNNLTPDNMGTGAQAIDFDQGIAAGVANELWFMPDGTVQDQVRNLNSGVVYIARPTDLMSSRAVSIYGATGRARAWRLMRVGAGVQWVQQ
jgi:type II secretory pathway pseudopilin PulG